MAITEILYYILIFVVQFEWTGADSPNNNVLTALLGLEYIEKKC